MVAPSRRLWSRPRPQRGGGLSSLPRHSPTNQWSLDYKSADPDSANQPEIGDLMFQRYVERRVEESLADTPVVLVRGLSRRSLKSHSSRPSRSRRQGRRRMLSALCRLFRSHRSLGCSVNHMERLAKRSPSLQRSFPSVRKSMIRAKNGDLLLRRSYAEQNIAATRLMHISA